MIKKQSDDDTDDETTQPEDDSEDDPEPQGDDTVGFESCEDGEEQVQAVAEKEIDQQPGSSRSGRSTRGNLPARFNDYVVSITATKQRKPIVRPEGIVACTPEEVWPSTVQLN